jgi:hypothetical protein
MANNHYEMCLAAEITDEKKEKTFYNLENGDFTGR